MEKKESKMMKEEAKEEADDLSGDLWGDLSDEQSSELPKTIASLSASSTQGWKSKEDYKKEKELQEARKAGTAPAEVDEDGKEINPHIPQYIATTPWYLAKSDKPSLKHQRTTIKGGSTINEYIKLPPVQSEAATKFRKGACTNCGAKTHALKDCVERPRKVGAKYSGKDIQPDEYVHEMALDYDGKRDRWNGYDPKEHSRIIEYYERTDAERRARKTEQIESSLSEGQSIVQPSTPSTTLPVDGNETNPLALPTPQSPTSVSIPTPAPIISTEKVSTNEATAPTGTTTQKKRKIKNLPI